jgi:hypothetical protein
VKASAIPLLLVVLSTCQVTDGYTVEKSVKNIKTRHESQPMAMPGVVSVGIGKDEVGHPVIVIGIESESHLNMLTLPRELEGIPVKVQVTGTIRPK